MKKVLFISALVVVLASCTMGPKPLYTWKNYDDASYGYLKKNDDKSTKALMDTYQKIIDKQKGSRNTVPPGIYADYGFLLLQSNRTAEGKNMLAKEIELYPESKPFVERILKTLE